MTEKILATLTAISNDWWQVAVAWHVCLALVLVSLALRRPPRRREAATGAVSALVSVAIAAWAFGNPFNGVAFLVLGGIALVIGRRLPASAVAGGPLWATVPGGLLVAFGWVYPHFLHVSSPWLYLVAAPVGLIPCPTLSCLIGFSLLGNSLGSRAWGLTLGLAGLFYGAFGAFRLHVGIDLVLLAGAAVLVALALVSPRSEAPAVGPADQATDGAPASRANP